MSRRRTALVVVSAVALLGLLGGTTWAAAREAGWTGPGGSVHCLGQTDPGYGPGMMGPGYGPGMMGQQYGLPGDGRRVESLAAARQRAQVFADRLGLRAGEVMQFDNGFYAELTTVDGRGATEVLVDPRNGSVIIEYGPAMMWNTSYGMHAGGQPGALRVSEADAVRLAQQWLRDQRSDLTVEDAEQFPGYFTLHTVRGGTVVGMLSVNGYTGAVWPHTWHGRFIAMTEE